MSDPARTSRAKMKQFFLPALLLLFAVLPFAVYAANGAGNAMCNPWFKQCPCGIAFDGKDCKGAGNTANCPVGVCVDSANGFPVPGTCPAPGKCKAGSAPGMNGQQGGVDSALKGIMDAIKGIMDAMKGKGGGGGGGGGQPPPTQPQNPNVCTTGYYQVSSPSSDPCAQYAPSTSNLLNTTGATLTGGGTTQSTSDLLDSLGRQNALNAGGSAPDQNANQNAAGLLLNAGQTGQNNQGANTAGQTSSDALLNAQGQNGLGNPFLGEGVGGGLGLSASDLLSAQSGVGASDTGGNSEGAPAPTKTAGIPGLQSGTQGDVKIFGTGITILANSRDVKGNTEVAGFYGSDLRGNMQPQGLVAQLCASRPWGSSFVSIVIPPSFFDGLCAVRGYQVGSMPPPKPAPAAQYQSVASQAAQKKTAIASTTPKTATTTISAASSTPAVPPQVDIWAVPASVSLGARASIFWNTKGVASCTETSPDGSFNQSSLSGGAATVSLSGATTFTISCLTPDGKHVTDFVTVNIST